MHTGQHYDDAMSKVFLAELDLPEPDVRSSASAPARTASRPRARSSASRRSCSSDGPSLVVVPGDVNSTLAAALAAVKLRIPVAHLESGLRSFDPAMPEEHNRRLTDHLSDILLTHSAGADANLEREGIDPARDPPRRQHDDRLTVQVTRLGT